jgi:branched-chain amino acid aminotransferase
VLTHGLHYASSVFEGIRSYNGKVFKHREHYERFHRSAELLDFKIPYSVDTLMEATDALLRDMNLKEAYIRPVAYRGSEMMAISAQKTTTHVAIACWVWPHYHPKESLQQGLRLNISKWKRPSPETIPSASKAAGLYMICTMSKHDAEREGFHDAMMLDYRGFLAEATGANLFLILNGITRLTVIDLARAKGLKVVERHIKPEELANTGEVFLTGTAAEIKPVSQIGDYHFTVGPITMGLIDDYSALVRA